MASYALQTPGLFFICGNCDYKAQAVVFRFIVHSNEDNYNNYDNNNQLTKSDQVQLSIADPARTIVPLSLCPF